MRIAKKEKRNIHNIKLRMTVFLCGAIGMILELVGSRLLAPYFGNGLFVWTTLIGIMLGFMSVGNYLGGRLADRDSEVGTLFWVLLVSSVSIMIVSIVETRVLQSLTSIENGKVSAILSAVLLFGVPCTLLGMVTPFCTRIVMHTLAKSGQTVGSLFALGTLGSIGGTFLAGFYLIALVGSRDLLGWLSAALLVLAVLYIDWKNKFQLCMSLVVLLLIITSASIVEPPDGSVDTGYDRYFISKEVDAQTGRPVTILARDSKSMESAVFSDTGEPYMFDYYKFYDLGLFMADKVEKTLLIGGGTFAYPRHQLEMYAESSCDVVEIDPDLIAIAKSDFYLKPDARLHVYAEDGRTFLNRATGKYDVVLIDAFKSANSIPYQLTTIQSMRRCYDVLEKNGLLVMNVIASMNGPGAKFVGAEIRTLKAVFPQVEAYAVYNKSDTTISQNISIIASKSDSKSLKAIIEELEPALTYQNIHQDDFNQSAPILTDDFAPVDQYLLDI